MERSSNIDALRGMAAVAVVTGHIYQQFYIGDLGPAAHRLLSWGGVWGVALFFVLSGFCIHLPQAERRRRAALAGSSFRFDRRAFCMRRFLRIVPPYWAALAASFLFGALATPRPNLLDGSTSLLDLLAHALAVHGLVPGFLESVNAVFWTIGVEIQFYLLYMLFAERALNARTLLVLILVGLVSYGAFAVFFPPSDPRRRLGADLFVTLFWQWYMGALLAEYHVRYEPVFRAARSRFAVHAARLALLASSFLLSMLDATIFGLHVKYWIAPVLCAAILLSFLVDCGERENPATRLLAGLGLVSYSLYLLHPIAIGCALLASGGGHSSAWLGIVAFALSLSFAVIGYMVVERPILRWRSVILERRRDAAPAIVAAKEPVS
jgi:peptidoglycan/LPS O-acetylase OafA/YrhL